MTERDDLPLPDYDHLQVGSLTSRIRTLGHDDLQTLITYERSHANRVQVVAAMENRLTSLKAGAQPSGGDPNAPVPEAAPPPAGGARGPAAPPPGRWAPGLRGPQRPARQPAVPGRPHQPSPAAMTPSSSGRHRDHE